jgi:hypothetical protein
MKHLEAMIRSLQIVLEDGPVSIQGTAVDNKESPPREIAARLVPSQDIEQATENTTAAASMGSTQNKDSSEKGAGVRHNAMNQDSSTESGDDGTGNVSSGEGQQASGDSATKDGDDAWLKFGVGALAVVAGGFLLSIAGNNDDSNGDQSGGNTRTNAADGERRANSSTVVIEELSDDGDDDWVAIPKSEE